MVNNLKRKQSKESVVYGWMHGFRKETTQERLPTLVSQVTIPTHMWSKV